MAARDALSSANVVAKLVEALPADVKLRDSVAALAALVHGLALALDFRLTSPLPRLLDGATDFTFGYAHPQSAMRFEFKVGKLGGRALVHGIAVEDDKTKTLDITLKDFFSTSAFSSPVAVADVAGTLNSPARLQDLINDICRAIVQPLIPGLQKEGYTEASATADDARNAARGGGAQPQSQPGRGGFYPDPGGVLPDRGGPMPQPPLVPPLGGAPGPSRSPFADIGRSDLEPLGGLAGTTGGRVPLGGLEGDGMLVGPNHPLFRDRFPGEGDPLRLPGRGPRPGGGPWGGDGFLPPMGAPPGARFDPVGPFMGGPRPGQGGFGNPGPGGRGGRPMGGGGGMGGGEPDPDDFQPPQGHSDYDNMFS